MPRKARIDAPGALHHIIVRGIARRKVFDDNADRDFFVERLGTVLSDTETQCFAYLEKVHAMPKQGVSSTFKFGLNYGFLIGCLTALRIPFEFVTPNTWQKALSCQSKGDKNVTKAKAQQLFPHLKIIHTIADALLIAEYGRRIR